MILPHGPCLSGCPAPSRPRPCEARHRQPGVLACVRTRAQWRWWRMHVARHGTAWPCCHAAACLPACVCCLAAPPASPPRRALLARSQRRHAATDDRAIKFGSGSVRTDAASAAAAAAASTVAYIPRGVPSHRCQPHAVPLFGVLRTPKRGLRESWSPW